MLGQVRSDSEDGKGWMDLKNVLEIKLTGQTVDQVFGDQEEGRFRKEEDEAIGKSRESGKCLQGRTEFW